MVITGRTRNALALTGSWVRIPPSPPKNSCLQEQDFFYPSRQTWHIINKGLPLLYIITPLGVYTCRLDDIQLLSKLMICNSFGIDDVQGFALIYYVAEFILFAAQIYHMAATPYIISRGDISLKSELMCGTISSLNKNLPPAYKNKGWLDSPLTVNGVCRRMSGGGEPI